MMDYPGVPGYPSWGEAFVAERWQAHRLLSACLVLFSNPEVNCCIQANALISKLRPLAVRL
jgi:hypothetical protein